MDSGERAGTRTERHGLGDPLRVERAEGAGGTMLEEEGAWVRGTPEPDGALTGKAKPETIEGAGAAM